MAIIESPGTLNKEGAVVIGGDYRALGVVRSLGRRGIPVWVLTNEHLVATASRYTQKHLRWPSDKREQVPFIMKLHDDYSLNGWALFPSDDEAVAFLSRNHSALAGRFRMTTPPWETMRWTYDKRLTYSIASKCGIDQPATFFAANREEVAVLDVSFPVILKPAYKPNVNRFTRAKAWRADNRTQLLTAYDAACGLVDPSIIMIQEFIPGGGNEQLSYAALCIEGSPRVSITARRKRQYPLEFGRASSFVESIDLPELEQTSRRLLQAIGLTGLVEVEYKRNPATGSFQLLDVNARVWGWHTLGTKHGMDFPYLVWKAIHQEPVHELHAPAGIRWVRMLTDVEAAAAEIRRGRLSLSDYLRSLRPPLDFAVFAPDDPLPALLDIPFLAWVGLKRSLRPLPAAAGEPSNVNLPDRKAS